VSAWRTRREEETGGRREEETGGRREEETGGRRRDQGSAICTHGPSFEEARYTRAWARPGSGRIDTDTSAALRQNGRGSGPCKEEMEGSEEMRRRQRREEKAKEGSREEVKRRKGLREKAKGTEGEGRIAKRKKDSERRRSEGRIAREGEAKEG